MLIANMIGRNEGERYLPEVLDRLNRFVDLIVFTDDCSEDDTLAIAKNFGAQTQQTSEPMFAHHEGRLRQYAWDYLSQHAVAGRDWVLAIDCDELLYNYEYLHEYTDQRMFDVVGITFYNMWSEDQYRVDKAWAPDIHPRLFRFMNGGVFKDRVLACGSIPTYVDRFMAVARYNPYTDLKMKHMGYSRPEDRQMKYDRYMRIDGGQYHSRMHLESIADAHPKLQDWKWNV